MQQERVGVSRRGLGAGDECWRNAPGMSDRAFLEAACSTRADVAPGEITGSSFQHCLPFFFFLSNTHTHTHTHTAFTDPHTHSSGTFSAVQPSRGKSLRGNLTPSWGAVATSNLYRWFYLLFTRIYVCEFEAAASCW